MRRMAYAISLVLIAAAAIASHECGHNPPGGGCVYIPYQGNDHQCHGGPVSGGGGPAPTNTPGNPPPATPTPPVPDWPAGPWGSSIPHGLPDTVIPVHLTASVSTWDADWVGHYYNAVGWWNSNLRYAPFHDSQNLLTSGVWIR